jgi:hypothetical protein
VNQVIGTTDAHTNPHFIDVFILKRLSHIFLDIKCISTNDVETETKIRDTYPDSPGTTKTAQLKYELGDIQIPNGRILTSIYLVKNSGRISKKVCRLSRNTRKQN